MNRPKILPVIHYIDRATAFNAVGKALECEADGCFLISHHGNDVELLEVAVALQAKHPGFPIGINLLSTPVVEAAVLVRAAGLPFFWADDVGIDSHGITPTALKVKALNVDVPSFGVFASVAFKYRPHEPDPALAAKKALEAGFIPTTSGKATASAPEIEKIKAMSQATGGVLAIASGMTPENVGTYAPYLSHILVASGIAIDEHMLDSDKLRLLIANAVY